jgi:hypothetical protein
MTYRTMKRYWGNEFIVACIRKVNTRGGEGSALRPGSDGRRLGEAVVNSSVEESTYSSSESHSDSSVVQLVSYSVYRLSHPGCPIIRSSVLKYVGIHSCAPLGESVLCKRMVFHRRPELTGSHYSILGAQRGMCYHGTRRVWTAPTLNISHKHELSLWLQLTFWIH